jgi:hypothetical protein
MDMVTEYKAKSRVSDDLLSFLTDNECSEIEVDLLRFMGQHPKAKLSFYVITRAFRISTVDLGNALMALVERGILVHRLDDNGLVTYSLSTDENIRTYIHKLAALDWSAAMAMKNELKSRMTCYLLTAGQKLHSQEITQRNQLI